METQNIKLEIEVNVLEPEQVMRKPKFPKANAPPLWLQRSLQAGLDPMITTKNLNYDRINMLLKSERLEYQLTELELLKLKEFVELHLKMESYLQAGSIPGADEVLNLLARLAGNFGDMKDLHPADEVAILSILQFASLWPQLNEYYNNEQVDKLTEGAYQYIRFKNINREEVIMQKMNYVKGQLVEEAITAKIIKFQSFRVLIRILLLVLMAFYIIIKVTVVTVLLSDSTANAGYDEMSRPFNLTDYGNRYPFQ